MIRGLSTFPFLIDESTNKESEWMMKSFELLVKTMYCTGFSSEYGSFFWKTFLHALFLNTAPHPVLLLSLKPSV